MFLDILYYIKLKWKEKKKRRNLVIRWMLVIMAAVVWLMSGVMVLKGRSVKADERIVSAFGSEMFTDMSSTITANEKYGNCEVTDSVKKAVLVQMANDMGIYNYSIEDYVDEENNSVKCLSQLSTNGDVIEKFITDGKNNQYINVLININKGIESAFTYENILNETFDKLGINDAEVYVSLCGKINGKLTLENKNIITDEMLEKINAKIVFENRTEELYTVYAYSRKIGKSVEFGCGKVNVNISSRYDSESQKTVFYLSVPINEQDY